uniref:Uncharacterized protein n=1 Tax=Arundo donax TaxID=35708 RepID=A0A0A9ALC8_ARUDO
MQLTLSQGTVCKFQHSRQSSNSEPYSCSYRG